MAEVIIALDRPSAEEALSLVDALGSEAHFYKVGLELYGAAGPPVVRELRRRDKRVFLDLKFHDIPNTVARAVAAAVRLDVQLLTVHAAGGPAMLEAASEAAGPDVGVVAVTVLTSLSPSDVEAIWGREIDSIRDEVIRLAALALEHGMDGVVASALEARWLRRTLGEEALLVTPGIRPAGGPHGDQKRVSTPGDAVAAGSDYLVVGRSITQAPDPAEALNAVLAEVAAAESAP